MTTEAETEHLPDASEVWRIIGHLEEGQQRIVVAIEDLRVEQRETNRRIDATNQRIDATNQRIDATNQRIDEGLREMNLRIDETNRRIDRVFYAVIAVGGALLVSTLGIAATLAVRLFGG